MAKPLFATNLELKPKAHIRIAVDILHDATRFTFDLGFEDPDIALHFNPRFNYYDYNTIVCDTRVNGYFGHALKERHFPFQKGTRAEENLINKHQMYFSLITAILTTATLWLILKAQVSTVHAKRWAYHFWVWPWSYSWLAGRGPLTTSTLPTAEAGRSATLDQPIKYL
ncbi:galectin-1-like isoform X3 [Notamacropus eugenii]|uniref:galectin-1-like isoform X3 n=1 Tax=Notamacropus eugenii TaxID=9315 RepID=UPI003B67743C